LQIELRTHAKVFHSPPNICFLGSYIPSAALVEGCEAVSDQS